jgi:hypothetical protein
LPRKRGIAEGLLRKSLNTNWAKTEAFDGFEFLSLDNSVPSKAFKNSRGFAQRHRGFRDSGNHQRFSTRSTIDRLSVRPDAVTTALIRR